MNEAPKSIQEACRRVKTVIVNKKAVGATKVSFQERAFTLQEETRVASIEKKVDDLVETFHRAIPSYRTPSRSPSRYPAGPQGYNNWPDNGLLLATEMARHIASLMSDIGRNTGLHPDSLVGTGEAFHQIGVLAGVAMIGDLVIRLPTIDRLCLDPQHTLQLIGGITRIPNTKMGNGLMDSLLDRKPNKLYLGPTIMTLHTLHLGPLFKALPSHNLHRTGPKVL